MRAGSEPKRPSSRIRHPSRSVELERTLGRSHLQSEISKNGLGLNECLEPVPRVSLQQATLRGGLTRTPGRKFGWRNAQATATRTIKL
jgi:hypothetical protein